MSDEKVNGGGAPMQGIQVNPLEAARIGLSFLQRVQMAPAERQAFAQIEALLHGIAHGEVTVVASSSANQVDFDFGSAAKPSSPQ